MPCVCHRIQLVVDKEQLRPESSARLLFGLLRLDLPGLSLVVHVRLIPRRGGDRNHGHRVIIIARARLVHGRFDAEVEVPIAAVRKLTRKRIARSLLALQRELQPSDS
eukprot:scaffold5992_cov66-Phaeocystis_antarctica.AAC.2